MIFDIYLPNFNIMPTLIVTKPSPKGQYILLSVCTRTQNGVKREDDFCSSQCTPHEFYTTSKLSHGSFQPYESICRYSEHRAQNAAMNGKIMAIICPMISPLE